MVSQNLFLQLLNMQNMRSSKSHEIMKACHKTVNSQIPIFLVVVLFILSATVFHVRNELSSSTFKPIYRQVL